MPAKKIYKSVAEILDIFNITLSKANAIIKKHKIASMLISWQKQIDAMMFYRVYTRYYNPSLFSSSKKKQNTNADLQQNQEIDILQKIFWIPYQKIVQKWFLDVSLLTVTDFNNTLSANHHDEVVVIESI